MSFRSITESLVNTDNKTRSRSHSVGRTTIISGSSNIFTKRSASTHRRSSSSSSSEMRNDLSRDMQTSTPLPGTSPDMSANRKHEKDWNSKTLKSSRSSSVEANKKSNVKNKRDKSRNRGFPDPPTCLVIERSVGRGTLQLRWLPPRMDLVSTFKTVHLKIAKNKMFKLLL